MPITSRSFVRASVVYLCLGAVIGALLLINRTVQEPAIAVLRASHVHMLIVGWLTQFIVGVAWWLFPPLKIGLRPDVPRPVRRGQAQRGSESLFWVTFISLNVGIMVRAIFAPLYAWTQIGIFDPLSNSSDLFLLVAALTFILNIWNRVRALGGRK